MVDVLERLYYLQRSEGQISTLHVSDIHENRGQEQQPLRVVRTWRSCYLMPRLGEENHTTAERNWCGDNISGDYSI